MSESTESAATDNAPKAKEQPTTETSVESENVATLGSLRWQYPVRLGTPKEDIIVCSPSRPTSLAGWGLERAVQRAHQTQIRHVQWVESVRRWSALCGSVADALDAIPNNSDTEIMLDSVRTWRRGVRRTHRQLDALVQIHWAPALGVSLESSNGTAAIQSTSSTSLLHNNITSTNATTYSNVATAYAAARKKCRQARHVAAKAQLRCHQQQKLLASNASNNTNNTPLAPLIRTHRRAVQREHASVRQCELLESLALETLEGLERDRATLLAQCLVQALQAEQQYSKESNNDDEHDISQSPPRPPPAEVKSATPTTTIRNFLLHNSGLSQLVEGSSEENNNGLRPSNDGNDDIDNKNDGKNNNDDDENSIVENDTNQTDDNDPAAAIGTWRDRVRTHMAQREHQIEAGRRLARVLEMVAAASKDLSHGLGQLWLSTATPTPDSTTTDFRTHRLLESVRAVWQAQADQAMGMAGLLQQIRTATLEDVVWRLATAHKTAADTEHAMWDQLQQKMQQQQTAEAQYQFSLKQTAQARKRVESVDWESSSNQQQQAAAHRSSSSSAAVAISQGLASGGAAAAAAASNNNSSTNSNNGNPTDSHHSLVEGNSENTISPLKKRSSATLNSQVVSKGLANMFSMLPDGGVDQAMKIFNPSARASMAQQNLEQADEKQLQGRQARDAAVEATARALEAYRLNAEALLTQCQEDEQAGAQHTQAALHELTHQIQKLHDCRQAALAQARARNGPAVTRNIQQDVDAWIERTQQQFQELIQTKTAEDAAAGKSNSNNNSDYTYMLPMPEFDEKGNDGNVQDNNRDDESESIPTIFSGGVAGSSSKEEDELTGEDVSASHHSATSAMADPSMNNETDGLQPAEDESLGWLLRGSRVRTFSQTSSFGSLPANLSFPGLKQLRQRTRTSSEPSAGAETDILMTYFCNDSDPSPPSEILLSFACSARDPGQKFPRHYGRVFLTPAGFLFASWAGQRRLSLDLTDLLAIKASRRSIVAGDCDTLRISYRSKNGEEHTLILGGVQGRDERLSILVETRDKLLAEMKSSAENAVPTTTDTVGNANGESLPDVPPDETLGKMELIFTKMIRKTSIRRFYEIVWSEGIGTTDAPLFKPWLEKEAFDVEMNDWIMESVDGNWCGEKYGQSRTVKFKVQRKTHLYIGPPIANVCQTHFCRVEGEDKCVVEMTVEMEGIPYCDCFVVEVRWVATRKGNNDIEVQVGVFVDFKKSTFLKSKIRSGTIEETAPVHLRLFDKARAACHAAAGTGAEDTANEDEEKTSGDIDTLKTGGSLERKPSLQHVSVLIVVIGVLLFYGSRFITTKNNQEVIGVPNHEERLEALEAEVKAMHNTLKEILAVLKTK